MKSRTQKRNISKQQYSLLTQKLTIFTNFEDIMKRLDQKGFLKKMFSTVNKIFEYEISNINSKIENIQNQQQIYLFQNLIIFKENFLLIIKQLIDQVCQVKMESFQNCKPKDIKKQKLDQFKTTRDYYEIPNFEDNSISGIESSQEVSYSLEDSSKDRQNLQQTKKNPITQNIDQRKSVSKITNSRTEPSNLIKLSKVQSHKRKNQKSKTKLFSNNSKSKFNNHILRLGNKKS